MALQSNVTNNNAQQEAQQVIGVAAEGSQIITDTRASSNNPIDGKQAKSNTTTTDNKCQQSDSSTGEKYWQMRYEKLKSDYDHLQNVNQNLEEKLLNVVELFDKKKSELIANVEYEKSTLMADVNKLSTKLVDARIKLHDYEEKELLHAAECNSPCHRGINGSRQTGTEVPILTAINSQRANMTTNITTNNNEAKNINRIDNYADRATPIEHQQQMIDDPNLV